MADHIPMIASIGAIIMVCINILAVFVAWGKWSSRQETSGAMLLEKITTHRDACEQRCINRLTVCNQRFESYESRIKALDDYAHHTVNHGVRDELQALVNRVELTYARKDLVNNQFESLNELMDSKFNEIISRLDRIENGKKAHHDN